MKPSDILTEKRVELREIMNRPRYAGIFANLRVYGSVARGTDTEESDIDFLVDCVGEKTPFLEICSLYSELEQATQTDIDLTVSKNIPTHLRKLIEKEALSI